MKSLFFTLLVTLIMSACGAASLPAWAEQQVDVNIPGGGAQDLLNMTTIPSTISDHHGDPSFTRSCVNAEGRVVHQGDPEYKPCVDATEGMNGGKKKTAPAGSADASHIITIQERAPGN